MRVVKEREGGIVRRVGLVDESGDEVVLVTRFLSHPVDSGYSPNTVCAYGYDLRHLALFLAGRSLGWNDFCPATALEFLGYVRRVPSRRPAQRLGPTVATEQGRLLSPAPTWPGFQPGARVDPRAYEPLLSRVSAEGVLVVIVMQPLGIGFTATDDIEDSRSDLPPQASLVAIEGAVHAFFGDYGEQSGDGSPTVSRAEAQEEIVAASVELLGSLG